MRGAGRFGMSRDISSSGRQAKNFSPQGHSAHFWDPSSPTKGGTRAPAVKMLSPNHRATREFPMLRTLGAALCVVPVP